MTREQLEKEFRENPVLRETLELGLAEQWKYSAEPVLAKTGKGFLRSAGVSEIAATKEKRPKETARVVKPS